VDVGNSVKNVTTGGLYGSYLVSQYASRTNLRRDDSLWQLVRLVKRQSLNGQAAVMRQWKIDSGQCGVQKGRKSTSEMARCSPCHTRAVQTNKHQHLMKQIYIQNCSNLGQKPLKYRLGGSGGGGEPCCRPACACEEHGMGGAAQRPNVKVIITAKPLPKERKGLIFLFPTDNSLLYIRKQRNQCARPASCCGIIELESQPFPRCPCYE